LLDDHDEYKRMANAVNLYGDGRASFRIATELTQMKLAAVILITVKIPQPIPKQQTNIS
jgi:UDP-N-acetylglucosamine 2-epimerase